MHSVESLITVERLIMAKASMYIKDINGVEFNAFKDYPNAVKMESIAKRRTQSFALNIIRPYTKMTMHDALAAAYIQGMNDAVLAQQLNQ